MGANIGTTITAHIIRLGDIDETQQALLAIFKPTTLGPIAAVVGLALYLGSKSRSKRDIGTIFLGFGILFSGMFAMEGALSPLRTLPQFAELFSKFSNPIIGVLVGTVVTAIIQSSSASVGILQALTSTGVITFSSAFPIIMGQNIGTCITPVLASIGASKNAKRSAFVHVTFNVIGTCIWLIVIYAIQYAVGLPFWDSPINKGGVADFHTLFNVTVTLMLAPFAWGLEKLAMIFIRSDEDEEIADSEVSSLDERFLNSPGYAIGAARNAVVKMANLALENYGRSMKLVKAYDAKRLERAREIENTIDLLQGRIDNYLLLISKSPLNEAENVDLSEVLQVVNEFERIGDHADNVCDKAQELFEKSAKLSVEAAHELEALREAVEEILTLAVEGYISRDLNTAARIEPLEDVIDMMVETIKVYHSERLSKGHCGLDAALPYLEILYNLERIADHCSNVGVHIMSYSGQSVVDRHEFLRDMRKSPTNEFREAFEAYDKKYFERINQAR
jgi:phosphate:Na+ symporter